jgi:protein-arginine kinase activator protein McsA
MPIDYSIYPSNWEDIRLRILDRAQDCCEHCGLPNYAVITRQAGKAYQLHANCDSFVSAKAYKAEHKEAFPRAITIILTVAHLDHDEWNHEVSDDRLAALCQRCHFHYDRADNDKRKAYGKHYKKNQLSIL